MPNHVTTILRAPAEVLDSLKGADAEVDFNTVIPFPSVLENLSAEYKVFPTQEQVDAYNAEEREKALGWPEVFRPGPDQVYALTKEQHTMLTRRARECAGLVQLEHQELGHQVERLQHRAP